MGLLSKLLGNNQAPTPTPTRPQPAQPVQAPKPVQKYELLDDICNRSILSYKYEEKVCIIDKLLDTSSLKCGEDILFKQEPNNEYDSKAIAIYFENVKIGYVFKGTIQDMINSWIKRGDYLRAYLNEVDSNDLKITYTIGFYKPLEKFESKTASLIKTTKKIDDYSNRADNLASCDIGDIVTIEYDYDTETYIVFNDCYEEIGELSKSVSEKLQEKESDDFNFLGLIENINEDDNEKLKVTAIFYFTK